VYFRTAVNKKIKFFDLFMLDYGPETPVKLIDIDADLKGDVVGHMLDYSCEINREFVRRGYQGLDAGGVLTQALEEMGTSMEALIDRWAAFGDPELGLGKLP
jgi:hypothetical protein